MPFDAEHFTAPVRLLDRDPKSLTEPRERLEYLRELIAGGAALDMNEPSPSKCGSPSCLYGWSRSVFSSGRYMSPADVGAMLGLTLQNTRDLFCMSVTGTRARYHEWGDVDPFRATNAQAANVLDHLLQTGEVDWSVA